MISWLVIAVLIVVAVLALKMNKLRHRIWIIALILIVLFLYISATVVYSEYELKINTTEGIFQAVKVYIGWIGNGFQNLKVITGNVIGMDWTSTNGTFFENNKTKVTETS